MTKARIDFGGRPSASVAPVRFCLTPANTTPGTSRSFSSVAAAVPPCAVTSDSARRWRSSGSLSSARPMRAASAFVMPVHPATGVSMTVNVPAGASTGPVSTARRVASTVPPAPMTTASRSSKAAVEPATLARLPAAIAVPGVPVRVAGTVE
ncbi:hypothetical protein D3C72_1132690 [compost metagenome]